MRNSMETIRQEYSTQLKRFILPRVADEASADNILQDVFLRVYEGIDSLRDDTRLTSWIYQIARNAIIDYSEPSTHRSHKWCSEPPAHRADSWR